MFETAEDVNALQQLLDRSYQAAGPHLLRIRTRPQVSATHLPGEEFAVAVHGGGVAGPGGPQYARIEADRMFAFRMA